jgi:hypothetical protein
MIQPARPVDDMGGMVGDDSIYFFERLGEGVHACGHVPMRYYRDLLMGPENLLFGPNFLAFSQR